MQNSNQKYFFMQEALSMAKKSYDDDEVPVGAIIVKDNIIIGRGHNQLIRENDPTGHAEIIAIRDAAQFISNYRLINCDIYVTLEPCAMCAGAIFNSRIKNLFFGAHDPKTGACESVVNLGFFKTLNHHCHIHGGILQEESKNLLQKFFKEKRIIKTAVK